MRAALLPLIAGATAAALVLVVLATLSDPYFRALGTWQEYARQAPEGPGTAALFDRAVAAGVMGWDAPRSVPEIRADLPMEPDLRTQLFSVGEAGAVIAGEIRRARALGSYIAVRVRRPDCRQPCETDARWRISAGDGSGGDPARRLALGAARTWGPAGVPRPLPRLHAALWREAGPGYSPWTAWGASGPLTLRLDDPTVDQADVVGVPGRIGPGWDIAMRWCRDGQVRLAACPDPGDTAAFRLRRSDPGAPLLLDVAPRALVPDPAPRGQVPLTERLALDCTAAGSCVPRWRSNPVTRRYSAPRPPVPPDASGTGPPDPPRALDGWVRAERVAGGVAFQPSDTADAMGAAALIGRSGGAIGNLPDAVGVLSASDPARLALEPKVQAIAHAVLSELLDRPSGHAFADLRYRFPEDGARAALVVLDLRPAPVRGGIRAVVGRPAPPTGLSRWDMRAAAFDPQAGVPPGPAAWTGRGWQHIPGSAWKMLTALSLIHAATDPAMPPRDRAELRRILTGLDGEAADRILGPGVLTGSGGLCTPRRIDAPLRGASGDGCPAGHFAPIRDSGAGGPLTRSPDAVFGLRQAMAVSSNIWFAAALLDAERRRLSAAPPSVRSGRLPGRTPDPGGTPRPGDGMARTLARLGLDAPGPLDGARGLALLPRDAVEVEALSPGADLRTLASAAFGQQVQAGPLILAQLAGSIRTGRDLRPSLLEPVPTPARLLPGDMIGNDLLGLLRAGMRGVVSGRVVAPGNRVGTAAAPFRARAATLRQARIGGKTGTAERREGSPVRLSTFAGWLDAPDGSPRYAVGCAVSLLGEPRAGTRSLSVTPLCAHVVAELMHRLDAAGLADP